MVTIKSKQSFKAALFAGEDEIKVDDPQLAKWVVIIHGIKQFAWCVGIVLISGGIYTLLVSGGTAAPATAAGFASAAAIVGTGGATAMVALGMALGVTSLKALREKYKIKEKGEGYVILARK